MDTVTEPARDGITPRNVDFTLPRDRITNWQGGDPTHTILWNALSLLFPNGERFFIEAVLKNRSYVKDATLAADVKAFVQQEAFHTREHLEYNAALSQIVDAVKLEAEVHAHFELAKRFLPDDGPLLVTCALEHFTAIMAKVTLGHAAFFASAEPSYARLWTWHALEECEHKAVSYDVYLARFDGDKKLWARRRIMFFSTLGLARFIGKNLVTLMRAQKLAKRPSAWRSVIAYAFGEPGIFRRIWPLYVKYYESGFHPNDIDDTAELAHGRALVETFA